METMPNSSSQFQASAPGQTQQTATISSSSPNFLPSTPPVSPNIVDPPTAIPLQTSQGVSGPLLPQSSSSDTQSQQQQHVPSNTAQFSLNISRYVDLLKRMMKDPLTLCIAMAALALTVKGLYLDTRANVLSEKAIQLAEEANRLAIEESCRNHPVSPCPVNCPMYAV